MKVLEKITYKKNSKFEIEFTNLKEIAQRINTRFFFKVADIENKVVIDEKILATDSEDALRQLEEKYNFGDGCYNVAPYDLEEILVLDCKGSLDAMLSLPDINIRARVLIINYVPNIVYNEIILKKLNNNFERAYFFDCELPEHHNLIITKNILPQWNIPEDSAVLFLNEEDLNQYLVNSFSRSPISVDSYKNLHHNNDHLSKAIYGCLSKSISIIIPQLHAEDKSCQYHLDNVNNLCKELKEKYGVERIELFVSHCFLDITWHDSVHNISNKQQIIALHTYRIVGKITTTNSTGVLEVQENERLQVVDCVEFFNV